MSERLMVQGIFGEYRLILRIWQWHICSPFVKLPKYLKIKCGWCFE